MTLSMYQASVPVFVRALNNLSLVLDKGAAHATAKNVSPEVMMQSRLIADMLPLVRQVQIACDMVSRGAARLAGAEPKSFEDSETNFEQAQARIASALEYVRSFSEAQIDGSESREIVLKSRTGDLKFDGQSYLLQFVLPNLFFHCTTAYNILRESGAEIGKNDFLGRE